MQVNMSAKRITAAAIGVSWRIFRHLKRIERAKELAIEIQSIPRFAFHKSAWMLFAPAFYIFASCGVLVRSRQSLFVLCRANQPFVPSVRHLTSIILAELSEVNQALSPSPLCHATTLGASILRASGCSLTKRSPVEAGFPCYLPNLYAMLIRRRSCLPLTDRCTRCPKLG